MISPSGDYVSAWKLDEGSGERPVMKITGLFSCLLNYIND